MDADGAVDGGGEEREEGEARREAREDGGAEQLERREAEEVGRLVPAEQRAAAAGERARTERGERGALVEEEEGARDAVLGGAEEEREDGVVGDRREQREEARVEARAALPAGGAWAARTTSGGSSAFSWTWYPQRKAARPQYATAGAKAAAAAGRASVRRSTGASSARTRSAQWAGPTAGSTDLRRLADEAAARRRRGAAAAAERGGGELVGEGVERPGVRRPVRVGEAAPKREEAAADRAEAAGGAGAERGERAKGERGDGGDEGAEHAEAGDGGAQRRGAREDVRLQQVAKVERRGEEEEVLRAEQRREADGAAPLAAGAHVGDRQQQHAE